MLYYIITGDTLLFVIRRQVCPIGKTAEAEATKGQEFDLNI